ANDDLDRAAIAVGDGSRIAVAALEELDQPAAERMLQVAQGNAAHSLDVHGVATDDQLDGVAAGDFAAGIAFRVNVEGGQRRLPGLFDEGVDVDPGLRGGNRLAAAHGLQLAQVLLGDRVHRIRLQ